MTVASLGGAVVEVIREGGGRGVANQRLLCQAL